MGVPLRQFVGGAKPATRKVCRGTRRGSVISPRDIGQVAIPVILPKFRNACAVAPAVCRPHIDEAKSFRKTPMLFVYDSQVRSSEC